MQQVVNLRKELFAREENLPHLHTSRRHWMLEVVFYTTNVLMSCRYHSSILGRRTKPWGNFLWLVLFLFIKSGSTSGEIQATRRTGSFRQETSEIFRETRDIQRFSFGQILSRLLTPPFLSWAPSFGHKAKKDPLPTVRRQGGLQANSLAWEACHDGRSVHACQVGSHKHSLLLHNRAQHPLGGSYEE